MKRFMQSQSAWLLKCMLLFLMATGAYFYWQQKSLQKQTPSHLTTQVTRADVRQQVLASGTLQAAKVVQVGAQVSGEISAVHVAVGDEVQAGQLLAEIDARSQMNLRDVAAAALAASKAQLKMAEIRLQEAKKNRQRQQSLLKSGAISKENSDNIETAYQSALAALEQCSGRSATQSIELGTQQPSFGIHPSACAH